MNAAWTWTDPRPPLFLWIFIRDMVAGGNGRSSKDQQRAQLRRFRDQLSATEHARLSDLISRRIRALPEIRGATSIHTFWPMADRKEVDIRPLIAWLYTHKKQIVMPVVLSTPGNAAGGHLAHRRFAGENALARSRLGIQEPMASEAVPIEEIDVVIVPALGVDRSGNRLGYGKGHYDRFLSQIGIPSVCPVYDACILDHITPERHDIPVDIVVTEREVIRTGRS